MKSNIKQMERIPVRIMAIGLLIAAALIIKALHIELYEASYYSIQTARSMTLASVVIFFECSVAATIFEYLRCKKQKDK